MASHNDFGNYGETMACELLELKGYSILETNFRHRRSEIDIIAQKGNIVAVVEVKSRSSLSYGRPEHFVDIKKIRHMQSAVNAFIAERDIDCEIRFDIISVVRHSDSVKVLHMTDSFYHF